MDDNIVEFPSAHEKDEPVKGTRAVSYIEPFSAPEFFATDLARIHELGSVVRLILTVPEIANEPGGREQNVCVCKIILPRDAIARLAKVLAEYPLAG